MNSLDYTTLNRQIDLEIARSLEEYKNTQERNVREMALVIERQAEQIEQMEGAVHSCGPSCTKAACVNRQLREQIEMLRKALTAIHLCSETRSQEEKIAEEALAKIREE